MEPLENIVQNTHFKLRGPLSPNSDVVIAKIDEKSLDTLGRWPWPRQTMAKLVQRLHEYEAEVIGFDIIFSSPQINSDHEALIKLQNIDASGQSAITFYNDIDEWELYDLQTDLEEMDNLINSEKHVEIIIGLKTELTKLQVLYEDTDRSTY